MDREADPLSRKTMIDYINEIVNETSDVNFQKTMSRLESAIETFSDGSYRRSYMAQSILLDIKKKELDKMLDDARSTGTKLTSDEYARIDELREEIKKVEIELSNAGLERNPTRVGIDGKGVLKGESSIQRFEDLVGMTSGDIKYLSKEKERLDLLKPKKGTEAYEKLAYINRIMEMQKEYDSFLFHAPATALKEEVQSGSFTAIDPSSTRKNLVYVEAQLLSSDPEFITNPSIKARIEANARMQVAAQQRFNKTGELPSEILEELNKSAVIEDLSSLSTEAKALAKRNRAESRQIAASLRAGRDPRDIPALINRVRNHFASNAFREKDGVVSPLLPDSFRFKIATTVSNVSSSGREFASMVSSEVIASDRTRKKINMVNFRAKGNIMTIKEDMAATYKAALGTFDLDDSGLPSMFTFQDADGRTRISMLTMRDPKGAQEMIAMRPDLIDVGTLRSMLGDSNENIMRQAQNATSLDVDDFTEYMHVTTGMDRTTSRNAINVALDVVRGDVNESIISQRIAGIAATSNDQQFALETVVRMTREGMFEERLGQKGVSLAAMDGGLLQRLVNSGSASIRGQDVIDPLTGMTVGFSQNLGVEQGAPYSYGNFVELPRLSDSIDPKKIEPGTRMFNEALMGQGATRALSSEEVDIVTKNTLEGQALRSSLGIDMVQARAAGTETMFKFRAFLDESRLDDIDNTIGASINRISATNFLAPQLEYNRQQILNRVTTGTALSTFVDETLSYDKFSAGIVPPSDIVDVINQMSGTQKVQDLAKLDDVTRQKMRAAYQAIADQINADEKILDPTLVDDVTADNLHTRSIKPSHFAKAQLVQESRMLAAQRSMSMALGISDSELPGFDPIAIGHGPYGRMNSKQDIEMIKNAQLEEYDRQIASMRASGIGGLDISRVESATGALRASVDSANGTTRQLLSMSREGEIFQQRASFTQAAELGEKSKSMVDSEATRASRSLLRKEKAVSDSRYSKDVRKFLNSKTVKELFESYNKTDESLRSKILTPDLELQKRITGSLISEQISKALLAIRQIHSGSGANILDIVDTFESEMQALYGVGSKTLLGGLGAPGMEDAMIGLSELAMRRRANKANTYDAAAGQLLESSFGSFKAGLTPKELVDSGVRSTATLLKMSIEEAKNLLSSPVSTGKLDQDVIDYLNLVSQSNNETGVGGTGLMGESTRLARELFKQRQNILEQRRIQREAAILMGAVDPATGFLNPSDYADISRMSSEIGSASSGFSTEVPNVPGSPYRRVSEMLRDSESSLRKIVDSRGFRGFAIGATALITGSFIYQNKKNKDITQESIGGPPLMPGGNPYEQNYPELSAAKQDFRFNNPGSSGTQFRVNTSGSMQDLNKLRGLFGGVVDGPMDATMYDGLPMAGQDPYSDLASRF